MNPPEAKLFRRARCSSMEEQLTIKIRDAQAPFAATEFGCNQQVPGSNPGFAPRHFMGQ